MDTMTAEKWARVRAVVEAVLATPHAERKQALEQACCGDRELRQESESLLDAEAQATHLLGVDRWQSEMPVDAQTSSQRLLPGDIIDRYRILYEIGRGGMGAVYLAERADGAFQQKVALKLVQEGMVSPAMAERFRRERDIMARLNHPHIARLVDGGITAAGQPYAVMEYIAGEPIDRYCESKKFDMEQVLQLFLCVAQAVQFAHQNLVLHLDIKPANILVTADGEPRLLDFGIARLLLPAQAEGVHQTTQLLTPEYASPEQIRGGALSVASDVYSLGTLLYKLLTGRLPFPREDRTPLEVARLVCEVAPEPPGKVQSTTASRQTDELDQIVLQALRKEPERRYPTVAAFAQDITRYLAHEPVAAHADSFGYRAKKFVRRNRTALAVLTCVLLLILGSVISVVHSEHAAQRQERLERQEEQVAERRLMSVRILARNFLEVDNRLQMISGTSDVRKFVLMKSLQYLDSMSAEETGDPKLVGELALSYANLSALQDTVESPSLYDPVAAKRSLDKAVALADGLYRKNPRNPAALYDYVIVLAQETAWAQDRGDIASQYEIAARIWSVAGGFETQPRYAPGQMARATAAENLAMASIGVDALRGVGKPAEGLAWCDKAEEYFKRTESLHEPLFSPSILNFYLVLLAATRADGLMQEGDVPRMKSEAAKLRSMASLPEEEMPGLTRRMAESDALTYDLYAGDFTAARQQMAALKEGKIDPSRPVIDQETDVLRYDLLGLETGGGAALRTQAENALHELAAWHQGHPQEVQCALAAAFFEALLGAEPRLPRATRQKLLLHSLEVTRPFVAIHPSAWGQRIGVARTLAELGWLQTDTAAASRDETEATGELKQVLAAIPGEPEAQRLASQIAVRQDAGSALFETCAQRVGAMHLSMLAGPEQLALCRQTR